jgi:hypothetical protein
MPTAVGGRSRDGGLGQSGGSRPDGDSRVQATRNRQVVPVVAPPQVVESTARSPAIGERALI